MQSEVPALPVVCPSGKKHFARDTDINDECSTVKVETRNDTCKITSRLVSNRKQLHPLVGGPYRNSMRLYALSEPVRSTNKTTLGQRVMSAKMLRIKQLQNQLTDAHYHLNELANENRLLKALQKRQDSALRKYEGTNAELPRIINSHHEELKVLQTKHKKLRAQHKLTCDILKEKENEIYSLQSQNKHLMQLSKDRHLEEREKLQIRVSDLNFRIEQQQETIQTLNRKLALESKSLKHQLNSEVAKHKETQRHLHVTLEKLKNLEDLLDNREKRLYYSGRLPVCSKGKTAGSQSLMNLGQNGVASNNPLKSGGKSRGLQNDSENGSLPKLTGTETSDGKTISNLKDGQTEETPLTETMSSLHQLRKFRLQKSYSRNGSAGIATNETKKSVIDETERSEINGMAKYTNIAKLGAKGSTLSEFESDDEEMKRLIDNYGFADGKAPYKLPKQLTREFGYSSSDSENDKEEHEKFESSSLAIKSRDLHTRLIADQTTCADRQKKMCSKKNSSSASADESSETEKKMKNRPASMDNYSAALLRDRSRNGKENVAGLSVDDFLKLDIDPIDSDPETMRIEKTNDAPVEDSSESAANYSQPFDARVDSQERLSIMTKSWTELKTKIIREREISENQLKSLNEEASDDEFSLKKKLIGRANDDDDGTRDRRSFISGKINENFVKSCEDIAAGSFRSSRSMKNREELHAEANDDISHARQNGLIEDPRMSEYASGIKTEISDVTAKNSKESETTDKNSDYSLAARKTEISEETQENYIEKNSTADYRDSTDNAELMNFNKQKLLAAMKAIDDNENIDFSTNQKYRAPITAARSQSSATENLYRGLPTHARKKDVIIKEIFGDDKIENKLRAGCSKLH